MTDLRRSEREAWEAWREELFATTTPSERLFGSRMSSPDAIYASAEEFAADVRTAHIDTGTQEEFADLEAVAAVRFWTENYGEQAAA